MIFKGSIDSNSASKEVTEYLVAIFVALCTTRHLNLVYFHLAAESLYQVPR